jgi:hypothetical protein
VRCAAAILLIAVAFVRADSSSASNEPIVSRIRRQPVHSSAVAAIGYSRRLHVLEIEFVNGAIYRYLEVPPKIYRQLMSAESKARFYDENVRRRFRFVHVKCPN